MAKELVKCANCGIRLPYMDAESRDGKCYCRYCHDLPCWPDRGLSEIQNADKRVDRAGE